MSIISSEAESIYESSAMPGHPDLMRLLYDSDDLREAYERGAERQPTDEEIVAGAKAFYEALKPDSYPQWDSDCALRAEYFDAMRLAVKAMQGKAMEERASTRSLINLHRFRKLSYACSQAALIAVTGARHGGTRVTTLANWKPKAVDAPTAGNADAPEPKNTGRNAQSGITRPHLHGCIPCWTGSAKENCNKWQRN